MLAIDVDRPGAAGLGHCQDRPWLQVALSGLVGERPPQHAQGRFVVAEPAQRPQHVVVRPDRRLLDQQRGRHIGRQKPFGPQRVIGPGLLPAELDEVDLLLLLQRGPGHALPEGICRLPAQFCVKRPGRFLVAQLVGDPGRDCPDQNRMLPVLLFGEHLLGVIPEGDHLPADRAVALALGTRVGGELAPRPTARGADQLGEHNLRAVLGPDPADRLAVDGDRLGRSEPIEHRDEHRGRRPIADPPDGLGRDVGPPHFVPVSVAPADRLVERRQARAADAHQGLEHVGFAPPLDRGEVNQRPGRARPGEVLQGRQCAAEGAFLAGGAAVGTLGELPHHVDDHRHGVGIEDDFVSCEWDALLLGVFKPSTIQRHHELSVLPFFGSRTPVGECPAAACRLVRLAQPQKQRLGQAPPAPILAAGLALQQRHDRLALAQEHVAGDRVGRAVQSGRPLERGLQGRLVRRPAHRGHAKEDHQGQDGTTPTEGRANHPAWRRYRDSAPIAHGWAPLQPGSSAPDRYKPDFTATPQTIV